MRKDMNKVVVKGGPSGQYRPFLFGRTVRVLDDAEPVEVGRVRMKQRHAGYNDGPNSTAYGTLKRLVASRVGKPWATVYSELSGKYLGALGKSLREWVADNVSQDCYRNAEGVLCFNSAYYGVEEVTYNEYYVDPGTGLLCRTQSLANQRMSRYKSQLAQRKAEKELVRRIVSPVLQYHKREGVWFEVTMASRASRAEEVNAKEQFKNLMKRAGRNYHEDCIWDTFLKSSNLILGSNASQELYGSRDLFAVSHRALSREDVRRLNLP